MNRRDYRTAEELVVGCPSAGSGALSGRICRKPGRFIYPISILSFPFA